MIQIDEKPLKTFAYDQIQNYGFSFVLLNEKFQALHTPFMCKDYLQDMFWAEYTNATESTVYGLTWGKGSFSVDQPTFPLCVLGGKFKMKEHVPYLRELLNRFEAPLGIPPTVVEETQSDHAIVCMMPAAWTSNGPMLSSYTSLIRISGAYKGGDPIEYLKTLNKPMMDPKTYKPLWTPDPSYMAPDIGRLGVTLPRFAALLHGKRPVTEWADTKSMGMAHNLGIMGFTQFPTHTV